MAILSTLLNTTGLILFIHAAYSSYEHSLTSSRASASTTTPNLPTDIIIEALFSTALLVTGIILSSPALRPIEWAAWAGEAEKDIRRPKGRKRFEGDGGAEGVSMGWLDDRRGFVDVRTQRKEFGDWLREGGQKEIGH